MDKSTEDLSGEDNDAPPTLGDSNHTITNTATIPHPVPENKNVENTKENDQKNADDVKEDKSALDMGGNAEKIIVKETDAKDNTVLHISNSLRSPSFGFPDSQAGFSLFEAGSVSKNTPVNFDGGFHSGDAETKVDLTGVIGGTEYKDIYSKLSFSGDPFLDLYDTSSKGSSDIFASLHSFSYKSYIAQTLNSELSKSAVGPVDSYTHVANAYNYQYVTNGNDFKAVGVNLDTSSMLFHNAGEDWSYSSDGEISRYEVREGDRWVQDVGLAKERSEILTSGRLDFNTSYVISFDVMIEPGANNTATWFLLSQIQGKDDGDVWHSPAFALELQGEHFRVVTRYDVNAVTLDNSAPMTVHYTDDDSLVRGQWYNFTIEMNIDRLGNSSLVVFQDGEKVVDYQGPFGFNDILGSEWKQGVYRETSPEDLAAQFKSYSITELSQTGENLNGGNGDDTLYGSSSSDVLNGGNGSDILYGRDAADIFVFDQDTAFNAVDRIADFSLNEGDKIDISDLLFDYNPNQQAITDFVHLTDSGNDMILSVDVDGTATGHSALSIALLKNVGDIDLDALLTNGNLLTG